jgi:glutamate synthase (NADPH/NADH) small chain
MSERIIASPDGERLNAAQIDANFTDMHPPMSDVQAMVESSRCLYCYDAPCTKACPTSIDIPKFIHQIRTRNLKGSAVTILSSNIMGGTCARVCPTEILCEGECVRNETGEGPVRIGQLQRYSVDHFLDAGYPHPFKRAKDTGKKIAVVGAGPAGLACAHRLAMNGHKVTVFEPKKKAGGLNEYGLAAYKMAWGFAAREVEFLLQIGGITVENGRTLGKNLNLADLRKDFNAVFLGVGLGSVNSLGIDGEGIQGVESAIDFIERIRQTEVKSRFRVGDNVVVVGGGNTAIDAAVQAARMGARNVSLVYRRGADQMPATEWEQDLVRVNDVHVIYWAKPVSLKGKDKVTGISFERTVLKNGKLTGTGEFFDLEADLVLKAIGQVLDEGPLAGLALENGKVKIDGSFLTSMPGVWAGGDCVDSGEDLTVQAVDDGSRAAESINKYLAKA